MSASVVATPEYEESGWTVDFWLDPACPLTRYTARWIVQIANEVQLTVRWRVMSLSVLNEHRDVDPEGDTHGYLWVPARVAVAVQTEHGHDALGTFYSALWTDPHGAEREWIGDITEALSRSGLPTSLAGAGMNTGHDAELRRSHHDGLDRIEAEVGTPVLAITTSQGDKRAFFGPVLRDAVDREDAITLWEALLQLSSVRAFRELKS
ncbi:disulfide bond formation protein DsbA [Rhodococcus sp. SBT000017]|uniref:mycothiol-dependent nitroreductase Rv2466c family protein n=1 Tax=Rhodococcus sp. SBT000017 TaxID=1803385 RepID=UPI001C7CD60C|nr:disulfide bond formation protein DsbA [Rhodococcus sp. SBT000017]